MSILTKEVIQKILNDDWLLMDDCEGLENCTVIKELARMALAAMDSEPVVKLPQVEQIEQFGDGWDSYHEEYYLAEDVRTALTTACVKWCSADGESQSAPSVPNVLLEIMELYDDDPGFAAHMGVKLAEKLRAEISRGNK